MTRNLVRLLGAIFGAVFGVAAMIIVAGLWGIVFGGLVFFGCTATSDWIWRRGASPEEIKQDLEDRTRNTSS